MSFKDEFGARVTPAVIEFFDAEPNTTYTMYVSIKNIGTESKTVRIFRPKEGKYFKLKSKSDERTIAPGLELRGTITFTAPKAETYHDTLFIDVDKNVIQVPLIGYPERPVFELVDRVDLGILAASDKLVSKEIRLHNRGSKEGEFLFVYRGPKPLRCEPTKGVVKSKDSKIIKVEYMTKDVGEINDVVEVRLEGRTPHKLTVVGKVVERALVLLGCDTEQRQISGIQFSPTYYGTEKFESAILYNDSPEPMSFVCVMDDSAPGREMVTSS